MENINTSTFNTLFMQNLTTSEGLQKIAQQGGLFVRKKLREASFARQIIQPMFVTPAELDRSVNHEGRVKIVDIEPDSKAMAVTFRGDADYNYIMGERYEIPFFVISSDNHQKTEQELMAYEYPITELIERNAVLDIQKVEDAAFLNHVNAAIAIEEAVTPNSKAITGSLDTDGSIKRKDIVALLDTLDGDNLKAEILLMTTTMFNKLLLYPATTVGSAYSSEVQINGYTYATLLGRRVVVSNKVDLIGNTIYAFTHQDFFGQFLIMDDTKFWIDKQKNIITFAAYETIGMGIGNTRSVSKLTLSA
jgi:hypothetical protein